jgi:hypothetical protein
VLRVVAVVVLSALAIWFVVDALTVSDAERVEMEMERLLDLARQGGEDAVAGIMDAIAEDYRGVYSRETIERYLRMGLADGPPEEVTTGSPAFLPKDGEIVIPILRVDVRTKGYQGRAVLKVSFAKRGDRFRVVSVDQAFGR